ncbi:MAG TPA: oligosaccharide flippase family protein [Gemmatimonadaceae bacterium]|nr:oligosaccharide flippase family protein [Gemmatimonadaceae bacterium]
MLRSVSLYAVIRAGSAAISFLGIAMLTRLLDKAEYGRYALVAASASFAAALGFTWLRMGLLRYLPAFEGRRDVFLSTLLRGFAFSMAASATLAIGLWLLVRDDEIRALIPYGLLLLWATSAFELNLDVTVSQLQPTRYGRLTALRSAVGVGAAIFLAWRGYGARGVILGFSLGLLLPVVWSAFGDWRPARLRLADAEVLRRVTRYSAPLVATVLLEFVVNLSDRFFLGWLHGVEAAGAYAVGYDLAQQTLTVLLVTVNLAAYPAVIRALEAGDAATARVRLEQQGQLLLAIGLPAAAGLALLAPNIAHLLLGADFRASARVLIPWIAVATLIGGTKSYYFDLTFQLAQVTAQQIRIMLFAAATNVVANLLLIPRYGALGAAWATVAAYIVGLSMSWARGRTVMPLPLPWRQWSRTAIATLAMAAVLWPLRSRIGWPSLIVQLLLGAAVFVAAAMMLDVLGSRRLARQAWTRVVAGPG